MEVLTSRLSAAIASLPLKQMDGTLLASHLIASARALGWSVDAMRSSIELAAYAHRNQVRRNRGVHATTVYIEHPLRNAARLARYGCTSEAVVVAAVLHDVVEDSAADLAALFGAPSSDEAEQRAASLGVVAELFGDEVASIVFEVTNPLPPAGFTLPKAVRQQAYREHVLAAIANPQAALVKTSDLIDNAGGLVHLLGTQANTAMVNSLAAKYLPLLPQVAERMMADDVAGFVSADGHRAMLSSLAHAIARLEEIVAAA